MKKTYVSLSLLALTLIVYSQVHNFDFVNLDDRDALLGNPHVRDGLSLAGLKWAFTSSYAANWFPVTWITHMIDFQLFGLDAGWPHLINVMIHAASSLLLFAIFRRMTGRLWESAFVGFVFALHPLHVESVAWVTERKDVLSAFFWCLTTWLYLDYIDKPDWKRYLYALAAFSLGLMSKQMVVTLPFALLLLDWWPLERQKERQKTTPIQRLALEKVPYMALSAVASLIVYKVQQGAGTVLAAISLPLQTRATNALISYTAYLGQFFWPTHLAAFYPYPLTVPAWRIALSLAILAGISALAFRRKYLAVGWLWYLGTLVPVIGFVQVGLQGRADRYTYIPMIGISIMVAWGAAEAVERWPAIRFSVQMAATVVCAAWVLITWNQIQYWRNSVALFEHAIAVTDNNYIAHLNLGVVFEEQGRTEDALRNLYASVEEDPLLIEGHDTLGVLLGQIGRDDDAVTQLTEAIRISPNDVEAHFNLGNVLLDQGKLAAAANEFRIALRLVPNFTLAHFGLGASLVNLGQVDEAIVQFTEALRLDPSLTQARDGLQKALSLKAARGR